MTIVPTTLCWCLHILARHEGDGERCGVCGDGRCQRFSPGARTSTHHYQRGQQTISKRVARLEPGDLVLVGYPGHMEYVRGADGGIVWEQNAGEITSHPKTKYVEDLVLRAVQRKTGALLARVTGRHTLRPYGDVTMHVIETDLGDLDPMSGRQSVLVAT